MRNQKPARTSRAIFVVAAACAAAAAPAWGQRSIDGTRNNPLDPGRGAAGIALLRASAADYGDGAATPAGATRPSAREISNSMAFQSGGVPNARGASDYLWQWGQFLDHDIDLTGGADPEEPFDIPVPLGDVWFDPFFTGTVVIPMGRSVWQMDGGGVRQQLNEITAWIDASNVYGSDQARADELRALDGTGKLKVTEHATGDLLPFNVNGFPNAMDGDPSLFLAGDVRANEQSGLTAMHTLFVREHNLLCDVFAVVRPGLSGDMYYELARMVVGAEMQAITYNEFLPALLGPDALPPYTGYDPTVDAGIANEFSTAGYRYGHTQLSSQLLRLDADLETIADGDLPLRDAFFNPSQIVDHGGIEPLLRGLANQLAQEVDNMIVDDVRNFLFGPPGAGGFDLASLNIQRGRDHGLSDYNSVREAYGLAPRSSFAEITSDAALAAELEALYGSVDDIDLWVAGLAEDHLPGGHLGETMATIVADQFLRLRDGDRFWYQSALPAPIVRFVDKQSLSRIIKRNTSIGGELQDDVFHVQEL